MPTQSLVEFTCDNDPAHQEVTLGEMPTGWLQMVPAWDGSGSAWRNFDTMTCATTWYDDHLPA